MGNIRTPGAPRPRLPSPANTAEQQGAGIGQAVQELGRTVEGISVKLQARQTQNEITSANANASTAQAELTNSWREALRTADPSDTGLAQRFLDEDVSQRMDALDELATTSAARDHVSRLRASITGHFISSTAKGQADLAGQAAVISYETTLNQLSQTVGADPAALDNAINLSDLILDDMVNRGDLSRTNALKLQSDSRGTIAMSAAMAAIEQNPGGAKQLINSGVYNEYIDGQQKARLLAAATTSEKALEVEARRISADAAKNASNDIIESMIDEKGNIVVTPDTILAIARDPRLDTAEGLSEKRASFNMARAILKSQSEGNSAELKTNPVVFRDAWDRAGRGAISRDEVMGLTARGLSYADTQHVLGRIDGNLTPEGEIDNTIRGQFEKSARAFLATQRDVTRPDPLGEQSLGNFLGWALAEGQRLEDAGKSVSEIYASDGPLMLKIQDYKATKEEIRGRSKLIRRGKRFEPLSSAPVAEEGEKDRTVSDMDKFLEGK